jgi:hypothetical protein
VGAEAMESAIETAKVLRSLAPTVKGPR